MTIAAGTRLGPYEIQSLLGAGGMGEVYRANDTRLGRDVAIKILPEPFASDPARVQRFEEEARAIASLNHPHICQLHDVGPGYLVLEYVEGAAPRGPMSAAQAVPLALQIVGALEAAHARGVLHRDLKPANIVVTPQGNVKLLDFGLAKLMSGDTDVTMTMTGAVIGTPAYMSPEQAQGRSIDARSDVFSLGAVLYEVLSGRRAFDGSSTAEVLSAVMRDDPQPLRSSPALERIVGRCLAKQPGQRFQTMGELRSALEVASAETAAAPPITAIPSIAVLPFANMSANEEAGYFGDGLAEEVINLLAQMPGLKVAGRTSSFFFRGKDVEFAEIARRLNVDYLLEGSVRTAANRIRVTAQLIKVADGFHLWSERYDREMIDIFTIQDEITHAIGAALKLKLATQPAPQRRHVPALRAYQAYLQAREHWFKPTPESLALVKNRLEAAIELDPAFALPYGLLGGHYTMLSGMGIQPAREVIPLAKAAEYNALRIDPSLPEAHALLGMCAGTFDFDWREAERHWRQAMAHGPESRDIRFWYGNHFLLPIGRPLEAVEAMEWGLQEDPLNLLYRHHLAVGFRHAGRLGDAEDELHKVLEIDEQFPLALGTLGAICAQQNRFDEALVWTERARAAMPWSQPIAGQLAAVLARTGSTLRADALLETLMPGTTYGAPTALAIYYAMAGDFDQAAHWAERAIDERFPPLVAVLGPLLRTTPKWPALAAMMRLPG
jgi:TolB-like protein/Tfp pilus assembly protein PilF